MVVIPFLQVWVNAPGSTLPKGTEDYQAAGLQAHLLVPIIHRDNLLAVLSLQWQQRISNMGENELKLIHLSAQQVGLAIATTLNP